MTASSPDSRTRFPPLGLAWTVWGLGAVLYLYGFFQRVAPGVMGEELARTFDLGAAALIVAHNHPSGVSEPSLADQAITRRLKDALALLEIRLLDHFVIGEGEPVSMASRGLL